LLLRLHCCECDGIIQHMNRSQRKHVQNLAQGIVGILFPNGPEFPIDPALIVRQLGGSISRRTLVPDVYAEIHRVGGAFEVLLAPNQPETRERFTLAHELGHLFLHMNFLDAEQWQAAGSYLDGAFRRSDGDYSEEELQANEFAASLLMPEPEFRRLAQENFDTGSSKYKLTGIANYFGVSLEATRNRGRWLGMFAWDNE